MKDVVIIGGGPAGSALGCYLSLAGISNLILEKSSHPRPHVGESLVPATTRVFKEIGFLETMESEGFVKKFGASWHSPAPESEFAIWFKEFPQPGVDQDYTYHVDRSRFDQLLFQRARQLGSDVQEGVGVREVLFEDGRASGVLCSREGSNFRVSARVVVDASGRSGVVGNQLRLRKNDPIFNQFTVHSWFEGVERGTGATADFIHIYFLPVKRGWAWQIPITSKVTSVGIVAEREVFRDSKGRIEEWFLEMTGLSPDLASAMQGAESVTPFRSEADYSYSMDQFVGDGFLMVGDAARFVDPIFSSGVSVACYSAKFASAEIVRALGTGDVSRASLQPYETRLRAGVGIWYGFISLYYKLMHLFSHFITDDRYRLQILQLLQGEVYDREKAGVLDEMRKVIKTVEETEGHVWKPYLSDIPID